MCTNGRYSDTAVQRASGHHQYFLALIHQALHPLTKTVCVWQQYTVTGLYKVKLSGTDYTGKCIFQYVLRKHDVSVGATVVSSGLDGVFPKGLRVAKITAIVRRTSGIFQEVSVTPFVDFEKLEEVLVLLNPVQHEFSDAR